MEAVRLAMAIEGLRCPGEALAVERALARMEGVRRVYVNPAMEMAYIEYDPAVVCSTCLGAAVARAGYRAGATWVR